MTLTAQLSQRSRGTITPRGQALTVSAANGVLTNDYDPQGFSIQVDVNNVTQPANGTLAINPDGSFSYTPNANFVGTDTFTYTISNGALDSAPATVAIQVANQPVTAMPDSLHRALLRRAVGRGQRCQQPWGQ